MQNTPMGHADDLPTMFVFFKNKIEKCQHFVQRWFSSQTILKNIFTSQSSAQLTTIPSRLLMRVCVVAVPFSWHPYFLRSGWGYMHLLHTLGSLFLICERLGGMVEI